MKTESGFAIISVETLIKILAALPPGSYVATNQVGNISVIDLMDEEYYAIDL